MLRIFVLDYRTFKLMALILFI